MIKAEPSFLDTEKALATFLPHALPEREIHEQSWRVRVPCKGLVDSSVNESF